MNYLNLLGYKVRDVVTGFEGIAESIAFDLYGCIQVEVRPAITKDAKSEGFPDGRWFDAKRLKKLGNKRVMERPDFALVIDIMKSSPEKGPADKPVRGARRA